MKIPLNCVPSGRHCGSQNSWMTLLESVSVSMAAFAILLAEGKYVSLGAALFNSTSPPRTTPWLYDHLHRVS